MRLFVAIMLPEDWQKILRLPQEKIGWLGRGVKWVEPENLHLTLKFLGDTPDHVLPDVENVITEACANSAPFNLSIQGTGCFPTKQRPRAYWAGLTPSKTLRALQAEIGGGMEELGFEPEVKEFVPHLTVARIKEPIGKERITGAFLNFELRSSPFEVTQVSLVQSSLRQEGPIYTVLKDFRLGNPQS
ncbi:MAG: RNA 2',3'-cyclic phosphodiesterase [Calditrichaeota bacterium]|nr:RNA 2',3'-cyclic phosphodiesterase [Calditrichota bacterium]MCB9367985.1 RNA 2',3'-cyclic phosphodiesterase [Calditrichota bacterium]